MDIYEKTEGVLSLIKVNGKQMPYYYGSPEFSKNKPEPDSYIVYDVFESPDYTGDGKYQKKTYNLTVNIFTEKLQKALNSQIEKAFCDASFIYTGGGQIGSKREFPYKLRHYKEFEILMEVEENEQNSN